jgi:uncharacterized repeat protein (TIGR03803 family)
VKPKRTGHSIKLSLKSVIALLIMASASLVGAQTLQTLCSFNGTNGMKPNALTLGNDGNFYGTTYSGGITNSTHTNGYGTVFKVTTNGTLTTLVSFNGTNGTAPQAALTLGPDGNFYGTTYGTVFQVTTNGTLTTLVSFNGTNGMHPTAALTLGHDGNFYGTTYFGGSDGAGMVFKVTTNGVLTTLFSFSWYSGHGACPTAELTLGPDGNFYGTTYEGGNEGDNSYGTVFKVTTNGVLTTLVSFNGNNGYWPLAGLTLGNDGNFYGTTYTGGSGSLGAGTVFKVTTNGVLTTLASFNGTNGSGPCAALTLGSDGNFYGSTCYGGYGGGFGYGTVFKVTTNGTLTTLVFFNGTNGEWPYAALTLGNDGNFYGTTLQGGITNSTYTNGMGTVFRLLLPPIIRVQPQNQTNNAGATVTFLVSATSLIPLGYQWQKNGTNLVDGGNLSGSNTNALTITGISDSDAATYSVIVSNANFSITNYATLTVIDPPGITAQPLGQRIILGGYVSFNVSVSNPPPLHYQWRFNSVNLLNATNAAYAIQAVAATNTGNYSVVVTNLAGSVTSSNALMTVLVPPTLALQLWVGYPLLNLDGMLSNNFVVQYSTNLADTNWINLLSLTNLSASPYLFLDPDGVVSPARFYRAFMQ